MDKILTSFLLKDITLDKYFLHFVAENKIFYQFSLIALLSKV